MKLESIVSCLLDTDVYNFNMDQVFFHKKSDLNGAPKGSDGYPIFTPWIRATIHVNTVKDVENIVKFTDPNK